jgi:hypothetical protein
MQNWRSPWWILLTGVFPIGALLALAAQIYYIISPQLPPDSKAAWYGLGGSLLLLGLGQLVHFLYLYLSKRENNLWGSILSFLLYAGWLYAFLFNGQYLVPADIPSWMVSNEAMFYPIGLVMPNLAFSLYSIIANLTNFEQNPNPWFDLLGALGIPFGIYLLINLSFVTGIEGDLLKHVGVLTFGGMTTLFLFFLGRCIYILAHRPWAGWTKAELLIKGVVGMVFPIWGLLLNNGQIHQYIENVFGNFSSPWFYGLALLNGLLFTLPNYPQPIYRTLLFLLRSLCFPFIVYFALVFLPYLPIAIPAILAIGSGFLMLTPIVLLIWQSATWLKDVEYLRSVQPVGRIVAGSALIALVIPLSLYFVALRDRQALHQALDYVYAPNFAQPQATPISASRLKRVFQTIHQNKQRRNWEPGNSQMPYLSHFYNGIVLDHLTLGDRKLNKLEAIFLGKSLEFFPESIERNSVSKIKNSQVDSRWDPLDQSWRSTIHLEIENPSESLEEYRTVFSLPDGALIQDYYLYVGEEKVKGQLAEQKTATWIYEQIVNNTRRDPGLLSYLDARTLSFRVYPFQAKELRKTGFTVLHKEAFQFKLEAEHELALGDPAKEPELKAPLILGNGQLAYLPKSLAANWPKQQLQPHYHFIVDCSVHQTDFSTKNTIERIEQLLAREQYPAQSFHFHLTNSRVQSLKHNQDWQAAIRQHPKEGGFFAERAFEQILQEYVQKPLKHYPVMIVVGKDAQAVMPEVSPRLAHSVYNGLNYAVLGEDGLVSLNFLDKTPQAAQAQGAVTMLAYPNISEPLAYVQAGSLLRLPSYQLQTTLKKDKWESAALLQAEWQYQEAHPELGDAGWLSLVQKSFQTRLLTPVTAYLVLENDAQRRLLEVKQRQVLQGNKALDVGEDPVQMSEPGFWVLLGLLLLLLGWKRFVV